MTCVEQISRHQKKPRPGNMYKTMLVFMGVRRSLSFYFVVNILKIAVLNGPHSKCFVLGSK